MKSFFKRVLTTVIGIPAVFALIYLLPGCNHLAFGLLVFTTCLLGSFELKGLLKKSGHDTRLPFWAPPLLIVGAWVETFFPTLPLTDFTLLCLSLISFSLEIFAGASDDFHDSLARTASSALLLLYPSFFFTFLIKLITMEKSSLLLLLFFLLVFGNDTFAYLFGIAFGKNNRGFIKVSPNKSIAGFIGGTLSAIILSVVYCYFLDTGFSLADSVLLAFVTSVAANIGDLVESSFKRSAGVKDSGSIIPGRGGLLDSIDSLLASAPFFWILCVALAS